MGYWIRICNRWRLASKIDNPIGLYSSCVSFYVVAIVEIALSAGERLFLALWTCLIKFFSLLISQCPVLAHHISNTGLECEPIKCSVIADHTY